LVQTLREAGVEIVFGYPGGSVLEICDAFRDCGVRFVLTRHEQGAVLAADGYARATGRTGVCLATSGPGATNLITGLANAHMDSVPLVAITGQVKSHLLGTDAFQEADTFGITLPVTKHNYLVSSASQLPLTLRQAFHIARTGRPGPVLVDIPRDIAQAAVPVAEDGPGAGVGGSSDATTASPADGPDLDLPGYRPTGEGHPVMLRRAAEALLAARRPLIWAGGGIVSAGAGEHLQRLAELTGTPVVMSLMGLGAVPHDHPLSLGMLGMHGTPWANWAVRECDLLLALGVRFDDRATGNLDKFAPRASVVHIDIDPAEIGKLRRAAVPVVADLASALPGLLRVVTKMVKGGAHGQGPGGAGAPGRATAGWLAEIDAARQASAWPQIDSEGCRLHPAEVIIELGRATGGKAIVVADVGQNQMWAAQLYPVSRPRQFLTSGGLGAMGYAVPAAMGAQAGMPDQPVVAVVGDGAFQMTGNELATIVEQGLPVKILVLNNGYLGMVRQWQELFFGRRYMAVKIGGPDFVKLAEAYGVPGMRVERREELAVTLARALAEPGPALVECRVAPEANVFPIVPPGKGSDEAVEVGWGEGEGGVEA
jgi:acetolactate synthase-1/2/3 large subunit